MPTIVSMGVHILDVLGRHVSEIPPGQNIALIDEIRITAAGTAAGTSVDMAKLGCKVIAVGAAGNAVATFVSLAPLVGPLPQIEV